MISNSKLPVCILLFAAIAIWFPSNVLSCQNAQVANRVLAGMDIVLGYLAECSNICCLRQCMKNQYCSAIAVPKNGHYCKMLARMQQQTSGVLPPHLQHAAWITYEISHDECMPTEYQMYVREFKMCYWFAPQDTASFHTAKSACANKGGNLVRIDSEIKQSIVADLLDSKKILRAFIQGTYSFDKEVWIFDDGSELSYFNWQTGMPRNQRQWKYIVVQRSQNYQWRDRGENNISTISFVCEKQLT